MRRVDVDAQDASNGNRNLSDRHRLQPEIALDQGRDLGRAVGPASCADARRVPWVVRDGPTGE
eukprot:8741078-Pyramimonas_sp.AAC.1